jgi:hypothetical protein
MVSIRSAPRCWRSTPSSCSSQSCSSCAGPTPSRAALDGSGQGKMPLCAHPDPCCGLALPPDATTWQAGLVTVGTRWPCNPPHLVARPATGRKSTGRAGIGARRAARRIGVRREWDDTRLTDGGLAGLVAIVASVPGSAAQTVERERGREMSVQLRNSALKGHQTCRFLARSSVDIAA